MKKLVLALAMGAVLAGCNKNTEDKASEAEMQQTASNAVEVASVVAETEAASTVATIENEEAKEVKFAGEDGHEYVLTTVDNFKTATLKDHNGKQYELKEAVTASGMRLENADGVNISLKGDEGTVEIEKDKVVNVKEVK